MRLKSLLSLASLLTILIAGGVALADEKPAKQRGKRVRATLVEPATETAPAPEAVPAEDAEPAEEPAPVEEPAAEAAPATTTATETAPAADAAPAAAAEPAEPVDPVAADAPTAPAAALAEPAKADVARDQPQFQERIEVIEVQLDVVVEDGKGNLVTGLGPEDFVVTEEGREVEVTDATFYGTPDQLSASGEEGVARSDRYFILFFHDRGRDAPALRPLMMEAGQQAQKWVEELEPNDQVAVLSYDVRLKVMTDFTRDRDALREAISRAAAARKEPDRAAGRSEEPLRAASDSPSLLLNLPAGRDLGRETRVFEETLELIGRAAAGIVGRKNLILLSVGFGESDLGGIWIPDSRYYDDMEESLNDGNVAVYAVDLVGARRVGAATGIANSLSSVADDTAGEYYENFTTFATPLRQVAEDTQGYYLLSYRSEHPAGESGYRDVEVEPRDKSYRVKARKGYRYGETNETGRRARGAEDS